MGAFHSTQNFGWDIKWNGPFRFGTTRIFGTSLVKVVHFDRSSHFGRSDRNVPFHLTVPLFCILLTRTISKRQRLGSLCNRNVPFHWARGISEISNRNWPRGGGGRGGTWDNFCLVCAAGLSQPLPHYSLFCGQL